MQPASKAYYSSPCMAYDLNAAAGHLLKKDPFLDFFLRYYH